jgi:hypothetical protein
MTLGQALLIAFGACIITLTALAIAAVKIPAVWGRISAWIDGRMDEVHTRHMRASLAEADAARTDYAARSRAIEDEYRQLVLNAHNEES